MSRPIKCRRVGFVPESTYLKPAGIPLSELEEVSLSIEALEAIRLKDQEGLQQEDCAQQMGISRSTFHRVLGSARNKIAEALTSGKAIRIEGGNFEMAQHRFRCSWDGHEWDVPFDEVENEGLNKCPKCNKSDAQIISSLENGKSVLSASRQD